MGYTRVATAPNRLQTIASQLIFLERRSYKKSQRYQQLNAEHDRLLAALQFWGPKVWAPYVGGKPS